MNRRMVRFEFGNRLVPVLFPGPGVTRCEDSGVDGADETLPGNIAVQGLPAAWGGHENGSARGHSETTPRP